MILTLDQLAEQDPDTFAELDLGDLPRDDIRVLVRKAEPEPDRKGFEFVDGVWVEKPMASSSGIVAGNVLFAVKGFARPRNLGPVLASEGAYRMLPDNRAQLRKPDVSFVAAPRVTPELLRQAEWPIAPDLAVEVVSPNELTEGTETKRDEYLRAGVRLVWEVYLPTRNVWAYKPDGTGKLYRVTDTLPGEDVLPGFGVPVAELFEGLDPVPPAPPARGVNAPRPGDVTSP